MALKSGLDIYTYTFHIMSILYFTLFHFSTRLRTTRSHQNRPRRAVNTSVLVAGIAGFRLGTASPHFSAEKRWKSGLLGPRKGIQNLFGALKPLQDSCGTARGPRRRRSLHSLGWRSPEL